MKQPAKTIKYIGGQEYAITKSKSKPKYKSAIVSLIFPLSDIYDLYSTGDTENAQYHKHAS
jgi:hypothetical protein